MAARSKADAAWPDALFAHGLCTAGLILQRFGVTLGSGSQFPISLVIAPLLFGFLVLAGRARIGALSVLLYVLFLISALLTCYMAILYPDFAYRFSLMSFLELLGLYAMILLKPSANFRRDHVLGVFAFWAKVIAVFGLAQYVLQFAHLRLFTFRDFHIPASILLESNYHTVAPIAYGSPILRSNGFFLLEPSILSQVMALAVVVDGFVRRRYMFLPLYLLGMLASFSGTGVLILVASAIINGLLSPKQLPRVALLLAAGALAAIAFAFVFPQQFATLAARADPHDPSAQARYVEQLRVYDTIRGDPRLLMGFGPGAADGFVQIGSLSALSKLLFDYGAVGMILFMLMLVSAWWRRGGLVLTTAALLTFQFGGGYLLFPSLVLVLGLLCNWGATGDASRPAETVKRAPWARTDEPLAAT